MEKRQEYWGGLAAGSFFLVAAGAMMFVVLAVLDLMGASMAAEVNGWGSLIAVVLAAVGGLLLMVEAGNKAKAYLIISRPSSIASKNAIMMTAFMAFAFIYATFFFAFIPWAGLTVLKSIVAILGIICAFVAVIIPALELGEARGRAFWNASALIPAFITSGACSGLAAVLVFGAAMGFTGSPELLIVDVLLFIFLIITAITIIGYVFGMQFADADEARRGAEMIIKGDFQTSFWVGVIGFGIIIPLLLYSFVGTGAVITAKGLLVLLGAAAFRNIFLKAGVRKPLPGEENEWISYDEAAQLAVELEKRWQEKAVWLYQNN